MRREISLSDDEMVDQVCIEDVKDVVWKCVDSMLQIVFDFYYLSESLMSENSNENDENMNEHNNENNNESECINENMNESDKENIINNTSIKDKITDIHNIIDKDNSTRIDNKASHLSTQSTLLFQSLIDICTDILSSLSLIRDDMLEEGELTLPPRLLRKDSLFERRVEVIETRINHAFQGAIQ